MGRLFVVLSFAALLVQSPVAGDTMSWQLESVGEGTKPVLGLSLTGMPRIAFMTEAEHGQVTLAARGVGVVGWTQVTVAEGYFYGPLDFIVDDVDVNHIVYHDHQDIQFQPGLGDAVYATDAGGDWQLETVVHAGHDGWDGSIAVGPDGQVQIASIDPSQFGSADGVEWARRTEAGWQVLSVGSGPVPYEFATAIAVDDDGATHIAYHEGGARFDPTGPGSNLVYGRRASEATTFVLEAVDLAGDVGKFPSLALDAAGDPHVAYFERTGPNAGFIKYAVRSDDGGWQSQRVAPVEDITIAFLGARRMVTLALDASDEPRIAWCERSALYHAQPVHEGAPQTGAWQLQTVTTSSADTHLGQMASMSLDARGRAHIAFYEVPENARTSTGTIRYAVGTALVTTAVSAAQGAAPAAFRLHPGFPNPFNQRITIPFDLGARGHVELAIFDLTGRRVQTLIGGTTAAGSHVVHWDGHDDAGRQVATGVYLLRLRHLAVHANAASTAIRKLTLLQ